MASTVRASRCKRREEKGRGISPLGQGSKLSLAEESFIIHLIILPNIFFNPVKEEGWFIFNADFIFRYNIKCIRWVWCVSAAPRSAGEKQKVHETDEARDIGHALLNCRKQNKPESCMGEQVCL